MAGSKNDITIDAADKNEEDRLLNDDILRNESPEEILINAEDWLAIHKAFGKHIDDHAIFCEWLDSTPPREIADGFNISASEVYNAIRRGTRIVRTLFNKQL